MSSWISWTACTVVADRAQIKKENFWLQKFGAPVRLQQVVNDKGRYRQHRAQSRLRNPSSRIASHRNPESDH
jgi:hypothetical protein